MLIDPLYGIDLFGNLIRIQRVESGLVRLKLGHVFVVDDAVFFNALEDNDSAAPVSYGQHLPLLVEGDC